MRWETKLVTALRILINDLDSPCQYTHFKLQQVLAISAMYVQQEISLDRTYTIDIGSPDINPDPTISSINDTIFCNFILLKAACMIDQWSLRAQAALEGIKAVCGPATMEVRNSIKGFELLLTKGPCATYEQLKLEYNMGKTDTIKAVLSPFTGNNFDALNLTVATAEYQNPRLRL